MDYLTLDELTELVVPGTVLKSGQYTTTVISLCDDFDDGRIAICHPWTPTPPWMNENRSSMQIALKNIVGYYTRDRVIPPEKPPISTGPMVLTPMSFTNG